MTGPRELVRRAAESRRAAAVQGAGDLRDALGTREAEDARAAAGVAPAAAPGTQPRPGVRSGHANYTALMRSHDRVRTRHLPVQGGAGRA